ncbi:hypothetical protein ACFLT1_02285 [Bacteroidota bacterium]
MKTVFGILFLAFTSLVFAQQADSVQTFSEWDELYRFNNFFISGQPEKERLEWFKEQEVVKIINLRSDVENEEFADEAFNEKRAAKKLDIEYVSIPISGWSAYNMESLEKIINEIPEEGNVVIHCLSGGRATNFFMAYLVEALGYDLNAAFDIGKQMRYKNPLEEILGKEIIYKFSKESSVRMNGNQEML